jgi:hypothetical protein
VLDGDAKISTAVIPSGIGSDNLGTHVATKTITADYGIHFATAGGSSSPGAGTLAVDNVGRISTTTSGIGSGVTVYPATDSVQSPFYSSFESGVDAFDPLAHFHGRDSTSSGGTTNSLLRHDGILPYGYFYNQIYESYYGSSAGGLTLGGGLRWFSNGTGYQSLQVHNSAGTIMHQLSTTGGGYTTGTIGNAQNNALNVQGAVGFNAVDVVGSTTIAVSSNYWLYRMDASSGPISVGFSFSLPTLPHGRYMKICKVDSGSNAVQLPEFSATLTEPNTCADVYVQFASGGSSASTRLLGVSKSTASVSGVTLADIQSATSNDFHNIGGTDDDTPDNDSEVPDTITVGASGSVNDGAIPAGVTRDAEWDTLPEIEAAVGFNVIASTEIDTMAELEALVAGTDIITSGENNDSADSVSLADVQAALSNDFHNVGGTDDDTPDSDSEVPDSITVGSGGTVNDAAIPSGVTRDSEWDTAAEVDAATTDADFSRSTHTHTGSTLSGIDISDDTNLAASAPLSLSNDTLSVDTSSATLLGPSIEDSEITNALTIDDAGIASTIHRDSETKDGDLVSFDDADSNFAATDLDSAISELDDVNGSGVNASDAKVDWSQLGNVPAGFADGTDATGAGGGSSALQVTEQSVEVSSPTTSINFTGADFDVTQPAASTATVTIAGAMTRDTEWDSAAEIDAATTDADFSRSTHTHTAATLDTDSVSADELNAAGVESELEAVIDLSDLQGQIADAQIADGAVDGGTGGEIADASVTAADLGTDSVSADELSATGVEAELEAVMDLQDMQGAATTGQLPSGATLDSEWDSAAEIDAATTDADFSRSTHTHTGSTLSGIDVSDDTNLAGDSEVVLTGDALSLAAAVTRDTEWDSAAEIDAATADADFSRSTHTHTGSTLSGIDISDDTNLAGDAEVVLTGDALSLASGVTRDTEWDTVAKLETATGANLIINTEIDTAAEFDALTTDADFSRSTHTHTASTLDTDSVSADELNALGVEAELEAVQDLQDFQGAVTDAQVPNTITIDNATNATTWSSQVKPGVAGPLVVNAGLSVSTGTIGGAAIVGGIDVSDDVNLTAGRSLTLTGDDVLADAELYTDSKTIYFETPTASDDFKTIWVAPTAVTITSISCESDQTVNFDLQVDDGSPTGVNGSDIACTTFATDSSLAGDTTMASGERMDIALTSVSGTPTWVSITFAYTKDD